MLRLCSLLLLASLATCFGATIIIDPGPSLEEHLCSPGMLEPDTVLELATGRHLIGTGPACVVSGAHNLTIRGLTNSVEITCTNDFVGRLFAFINSTSLRFENLVVTECGAVIPDSLAWHLNESEIVFFGQNQRAVFIVSMVTDLYINRVTLSKNFGIAVLGINLQGATEVNELAVLETDYSRHPLCFGFERDSSCSGSGLFILYSNAYPNTTTELSNTSLLVTNSVFHANEFLVPLDLYAALFNTLRSPFRTERLAAISGTGVTVIAGQRDYFVDVQITSSLFSENGGVTSSLALVPINNIREISFLVDNCIFRDNRVRDPGRGGAMVVLVALFVDMLNSQTTYTDGVYTVVKVKDTQFINNEAVLGGGMYTFLAPQNFTDYNILVENSRFVENVAQSASALVATSIPTLFLQRVSGILLKDVYIHNNTFPSSLRTTTSTIDNSAACVFALVNNVTIYGSNESVHSVFSNNSPGAVLVSGGKFILGGHMVFSDNLSFRGGAIALFDYTILHIHEGSRINFTKNHALSTGGAIYANSIGSGVLDICVFQVVGNNKIDSIDDIHLLDLKIIFDSNSAKVAGNSIYANPLYDCAFGPEASTRQTGFKSVSREVYSAIFEFVNRSNVQLIEEVSSIPYTFAFCNITTDEPDGGEFVKPISTFPGREFSVDVIPLDQASVRVQSVMYAELSDLSFSLGAGQAVQTHNGTRCITMYFNIYGAENSALEMFLYTRLGGFGLSLEVNIDECPPGFTLGYVTHFLCLCSEYVMRSLQTNCDLALYTISRPGTSWIGPINTTKSRVMWVAFCPPGYCRGIVNMDLTNPNEICVEGRTGMLCGQCEPGLSIVFGTPECTQCNNYWLFTILFYIIAGVAIVFLLFVLNLTVATGTINGLIFYVNIVSVNGGIFFESRATFVRVFISLLNLELGFPICFFDGMEEAVKIGFQYVFPTYMLGLCLLIILLSRWSSRVQRLTGTHGVAVLATLLYLSYGKLLRTVIDCLSFATVNYEDGSHAVWLYDGNLQYFTGGHIVLFILSSLCAILFLIPYTIPLVFIKQVDRHSIKLKPLFDAYAGPYKDKYRYWFGARLLLLVAVCVTYAVAGADYQSLALTLETLAILTFTVVQAYAKPYKNKAVGILDLLFLLNFLVMAVWLLHLVENVTPFEQQKRIQAVAILVGLAFVLALGILAYHIFKAICRFSPTLKGKVDQMETYIRSKHWYEHFKIMKHGRRKMSGYNPNNVDVSKSTVITRTEVSIDDGQELDEVKTTRSETFSQLREPVMSFSN